MILNRNQRIWTKTNFMHLITSNLFTIRPIPNNNNRTASTLTYLSRSNIFSTRNQNPFENYLFIQIHVLNWNIITILRHLWLIRLMYGRRETLDYYFQCSKWKLCYQVERSNDFDAILNYLLSFLKYKISIFLK